MPVLANAGKLDDHSWRRLMGGTGDALRWRGGVAAYRKRIAPSKHLHALVLRGGVRRSKSAEETRVCQATAREGMAAVFCLSAHVKLS